MQFATETEFADAAVLLYGPPGAGKTTAALSAPGPILLLNLEGPTAPRYAKRHHAHTDVLEVVYEGAQTLNEVYRYVQDPENGIRSVVVDSISELHTALMEQMLKDRPDLERATLAMWGDVNTKIERFVRALRNTVGLCLVLVCHEQLEITEEGPIRMPQTGGRQLPTILPRMVDVVGYCSVNPTTGEYLAQYLSMHGRYGKSRFPFLGEAGPVDIAAWIQTERLELLDREDHAAAVAASTAIQQEAP